MSKPRFAVGDFVQADLLHTDMPGMHLLQGVVSKYHGKGEYTVLLATDNLWMETRRKARELTFMVPTFGGPQRVKR